MYLIYRYHNDEREYRYCIVPSGTWAWTPDRLKAFQFRSEAMAQSRITNEDERVEKV